MDPLGSMNMPGGKPCKVCGDFKSWAKGGVHQTASQPQPKPEQTQAPKPETKQIKTPEPIPQPKVECPPGYKELGNSTWAFLHTTAAYYPKKPSENEQKHMNSLIKGVSMFYPCQPCAEHMREEMKVDPPKVGSQQELNLWMCQFHNKVNEMLGKKPFDCSRVLERWRDGPKDGSCD